MTGWKIRYHHPYVQSVRKNLSNLRFDEKLESDEKKLPSSLEKTVDSKSFTELFVEHRLCHSDIWGVGLRGTVKSSPTVNKNKFNNSRRSLG